MIKPSRLKRGDTIGIVAPASSFDKKNFKRGSEVLRRLGYRIKYERNIFNECWSRPGHDKQRAFQINRMFADKEVKAILCAKAGYGSHDIISFLDHTVIKDNPKIFVGYSDITILLLYLQHAADMVVFHGPVISGEFFRGMNPETLDSFTRLLGEDKAFGKISSAQVKVLRNGNAKGAIVGGNLTLIMESIGTPYEIQTKNKILFIEEINETIAGIIAQLKNLRSKGKLTGIKGIVFGRLTNCFEDEDEFVCLIKEFFKASRYPILYNFPSGHVEDIAYSHISLPLGIPVHINSEKPFVNITSSAVR